MVEQHPLKILSVFLKAGGVVFFGLVFSYKHIIWTVWCWAVLNSNNGNVCGVQLEIFLDHVQRPHTELPREGLWQRKRAVAQQLRTVASVSGERERARESVCVRETHIESEQSVCVCVLES